ncbi:zinc ribbon domain-containing protein [Companilactobacillus insicii]|uniref:zinc ribbon domain-containing protein n=1 Tax=Companilactobacillus insicii TaxID=1732567 RepID=UPI001FECC922|nr:zinc ribbon domain-containing protein [Companilactobacillus insicii]
MLKGQMNLNSIYSYKNNLGYLSKSKMMILVHARGNYEFFFGRRALGGTASRSGNEYIISFEDSGLVFMQVNKGGMFTGDNSFMPRSKFSRIQFEKRSWIGGHYTSSQYNMSLCSNSGEVIDFTVYTIKSGIDWLEQYTVTTISNLDYYLRETGWSNTSSSVAPASSEQGTVTPELATINDVEDEKQVEEPQPVAVEKTTNVVPNPSSQNDDTKSQFKFCANCGNKMDIDDVFCQKCGTKSEV